MLPADGTKAENFLRAQLEYLRDTRQRPPDKLNTRNNRLLYDGTPGLRFGAVFAPYDVSTQSREFEPYSSAPKSTALDLRWQYVSHVEREREP